MHGSLFRDKDDFIDLKEYVENGSFISRTGTRIASKILK